VISGSDAIAHRYCNIESIGAGVFLCLTGLFFLRVLGQASVAYLGVEFLPPMEAWYSGLIAYPILLPIQIIMLAAMVKICLDVSRDEGFSPRPENTGVRF